MPQIPFAARRPKSSVFAVARRPQPRLALLLATLFGCGNQAIDPSDAQKTAEDPGDAAGSLAFVQEGASGSTGVIHPAGHTDLCLDVVWGNNKDGTRVQISKCNGNQAQQWAYVGGMFKAYTDKCLNVTEGEDQDGTVLQIWTCEGNTSTDKNNLWTQSNGTIRWQKNSNKCLDVQSGKYASGTPVQIWTCSGSTGNVNQRWQVMAPTSTTAPSTVATGTVPAAQPTPAASGTQATSATSGSVTPNFQAGIHIDYDNAFGSSNGVTGFVTRTGIKPQLVANYVNISSNGTFQTAAAKGYADDAAKNGAKIISYATTVQTKSINQTQLDGLKEAIAYARGKGLAVEIRYGYEMNGSWSPPCYGTSDAPSVYVNGWNKVAPVVHAAGGFMVWCPNIEGSDPTNKYRKYLPSDLTSIDKVGLDYYLNYTGGEQPTAARVASAIAGIYPIVQDINTAHGNKKTGRSVPVTFGETSLRLHDTRSDWGKSVNSETSAKQSWLNALTDGSVQQKYPLYKGFTWFDYYKTEQEGGNTGTTYNYPYEVSQDAGSAAMFKAWYQNHIQ